MEPVLQMADPAASAHVHIVRRVLGALTTGDTARLDEFVNPAYVDHDAPGADIGELRQGPARFRHSVRRLHGVFAGLTFEEREVIAVEDRVVVRGVMRGRHVGPLLGIEPTGRQVEIHQVHIFRVATGTVIEHRAFWGGLSILLQLGAIP